MGLQRLRRRHRAPEVQIHDKAPEETPSCVLDGTDSWQGSTPHDVAVGTVPKTVKHHVDSEQAPETAPSAMVIGDHSMSKVEEHVAHWQVVVMVKHCTKHDGESLESGMCPPRSGQHPASVQDDVSGTHTEVEKVGMEVNDTLVGILAALIDMQWSSIVRLTAEESELGVDDEDDESS